MLKSSDTAKFNRLVSFLVGFFPGCNRTEFALVYCLILGAKGSLNVRYKTSGYIHVLAEQVVVR